MSNSSDGYWGTFLLWTSHQKMRNCPFLPVMNRAVHAAVYFWCFISLQLCCLGVFLSVPWRWVSSAFSKLPTQWQRSKLKHCDFNRELPETSLDTEKLHVQLNVFLLFYLLYLRGLSLISTNILHCWSNAPGTRWWGNLRNTLVRMKLLFIHQRGERVGVGRAWSEGHSSCSADCLSGGCANGDGQMLSAYPIYKKHRWLSA